MTSIPHFKKLAGLTLVEILIVIGIAAIISTLGISSFTQLIKKNHSVVTTNKIITALHYGRNIAVVKNTTITLCPSANTLNCKKDDSEQLVIFQDINNNKIIDSNELIQTFQFDNTKDKLLFKVSAGRNYIRFRSNGSAKDFGRIQYCPTDKDARYANQVIINFTGRPRLAVDVNNDGVVEGSDGLNIRC